MSLYKKHRPQTPNELVGNTATVKAVGGLLKTGNFPSAVLFTGPSGCGKTTLARMVAQRGLQCDPSNVYELNSANMTGVDVVRDIARAAETRALVGRGKVWILDEVHMLTKAAQEALLKLLEDGPEGVWFMLCTTNPDKLIAAIKTRCTELKVAAVKAADMLALLKRVVAAEGFTFSDKELDQIVAVADGSPRAALVTLEKAAAVQGADRVDIIGRGDVDPNNFEFYRSLGGKSWPDVTAHLKRYKEEEMDPEAVRRILLGIARAGLANKPDAFAALVIDVFQFPFYDSGEPGLYGAAFKVWSARSK